MAAASDNADNAMATRIVVPTFENRKQNAGESIADFVNALKVISGDCEYGEILQEVLRVIFIAGLYDANLQKRFFEKQFPDEKKNTY